MLLAAMPVLIEVNFLNVRIFRLGQHFLSMNNGACESVDALSNITLWRGPPARFKQIAADQQARTSNSLQGMEWESCNGPATLAPGPASRHAARH